MNRRGMLAAMGAAAVGSAAPAQAESSTEPDRPLVAPLQSERKSIRWARDQLRSHYGPAFHEPPSRGIYLHRTDNWVGVAPRDAIVQRAEIVSDLLRPYGAEDWWDCEDQALELRHKMTAAWTGLSTGVAFNSGTHVYNVFLTSEGDIVEFEPRVGRVVPEDVDDDAYQFDEGVLLL
jgi:hypothetical protein